MVSLGLIYGFFRVSCRGFFSGVLIRISLGFFGFHLGSLGFHLGYKQERIKQKKRKNKEAVKTGSREADKQEVEQQKHMTGEKKK